MTGLGGEANGTAASFAIWNVAAWSDLLPDREPATVEAWLARHPEISVISRDRGGGYSQAATRAAPRAVQVADRWHLMENASAAFLEAVRRQMRLIRIALGNTTIDPALLTHAERLQHEGYLRREEAYGIIRELAAAGTPIKEIVRRTGRPAAAGNCLRRQRWTGAQIARETGVSKATGILLRLGLNPIAGAGTRRAGSPL